MITASRHGDVSHSKEARKGPTLIATRMRILQSCLESSPSSPLGPESGDEVVVSSMSMGDCRMISGLMLRRRKWARSAGRTSSSRGTSHAESIELEASYPPQDHGGLGIAELKRRSGAHTAKP